MSLEPGTRVDRYELVEPLGEGGQGAVWKARDPLDPDHPCALKLVPVVAARPNDVERARREARALARLEHPSLVRCHGLFEDLKLGVLGIAMELVDGTSLRELMSDGRFGARERKAVLEHVAHALAYLHANGVVHRDVKLDNVLVKVSFWHDPSAPETVKLVDLGIASVTGAGAQLTQVGSIVGTISYLSPELLDPATFEGDPGAPAVDVFAFGVMGWQLLAGRHPSDLPAASRLVDYTRAYRAALEQGEKWPAAKPEGPWGDVLAHALRLTPADRISDGGELVSRIEGGASGVVVRPAAAGASAPTSVATPAAMRQHTEAVPTRTTSKEAQTVDLRPRAVAAGAPAPGRRVALVAVVTVLVAVGIGATVLLVPERGPAVGAGPSARGEVSSQIPVSRGPADADRADAEPEAVADSAAPTLDELDPCDAGCASGRGCAGDCSAKIDPDVDFTLRVGGAFTDDEGGSLSATYRTASVCLSRPQHEPVCTALSELGGGGVPTKGLYVNYQDLSGDGIEVRVVVTAPGGGQAELATRKKLAFPDGLRREALCQGLRVGDFTTRDPDVTLSHVLLFLDDANSDVIPKRCGH